MQAARDETLKQQIITAHDTLSVHNDHELKYPMDYPALPKKDCKTGTGLKAAAAAAPAAAPAPAKKL